jgi:anti-anti-sigma factor
MAVYKKLELTDKDVAVEEASCLLEKLTEAVDKTQGDLVLDLKKVRYLEDTIILGLFLHINKYLREKNFREKRDGRLVLVGYDDNVHEILGITGANNLLEMYDSIKEYEKARIN